MKVLHVNSSTRGGAWNSAYRVHKALVGAGVHSEVLAGEKSLDDSSIHELGGGAHAVWRWFAPKANYRLGLLRTGFHKTVLAPEILPGLALSAINNHPCDIVHLHRPWEGMLSVEQIGRIRKPVVWTQHDLSALSGGYNFRCDVGLSEPEWTPSGTDESLARRIIGRKREAWSGRGFQFIAPSRWMERQVLGSPALERPRVVHLPYIFPITEFFPEDRLEARSALELPFDQTILLFGADGASIPRKGFDLLRGALHRLKEGGCAMETITILVFGDSPDDEIDIPEFKIIRFGKIWDSARLRKMYNAADFFICPSIEDNLPNTVMESLCCATPVLGFSIGGLPDLVKDPSDGLLVKQVDRLSLAAGLMEMLLRKDGRTLEQRRNSVFGLVEVNRDTVERHLRLYEEVLRDEGRSTRERAQISAGD